VILIRKYHIAYTQEQQQQAASWQRQLQRRAAATAAEAAAAARRRGTLRTATENGVDSISLTRRQG